jgi:hypothetical protein
MWNSPGWCTKPMPMPSTMSVNTSAHTGMVREKLTFSPTPSSQNAKPIHSTGPYLQMCQW